MKHLGAAVVAVAIAFGVSALAQAYVPPPTKWHKREVESVTGKLTKIEGKALTIEATTLGGKTEEIVVTCDDATRYSKMEAVEGEGAAGAKGRPREVRARAKFDDLKVGQEVRVFFHTEDNVAVSVLITSVAPAPKETPKQE
jgi:hypothetical protein